MATYTYAGSFPATPALNETLEMNGTLYKYSSNGTWDLNLGVALVGNLSEMVNDVGYLTASDTTSLDLE